MTRKPKKRASIRRNLVAFAAILILAGVAVAIAASLNRQPRFVLDEDPAADLARRASPDNAHHTVEAVLRALPAPPQPVRMRDRWDWDRIQWVAEASDPAALLGFAADTDETAWNAFLEDTRGALEQARPALEKPYYLLHPPVAMSPWERMDIGFGAFGLRLVALGAHQARAGDVDTGLQTILDAIRLSRLVGADRGMRPEDPGVEPEALAEIRHLARNNADAEVLKRVADALEALGPPHPDRMPLVLNQWRMLDNTLARRISTQDLGGGRRMAMRFLLRYWQETADWINAHRGELEALVVGPPDDFRRFLDAQDFRWGDEERRWGPRYALWRLARAVAAVQSQYHGTRIAVALWRHHADHGAHAETLDALVPRYLPDIPADPLSGVAYAYRLIDGVRVLYSVGEDTVDHDGRPAYDHPLATF